MNRLKGLKLKFDVTDNPELSEAIQRRVFDLGGAWASRDNIVAFTDKPFLYFGSYGANDTDSLWYRDKHDCVLPAGYVDGTLEDLYTHTASFDGEDNIEIPAELFAALKEWLTK